MNKSQTYTSFVLREDADGNEVEIPVEIQYAYYPYIRGQRDSLCGKRGAGPPLEPDEPEHVEIESVKVLNKDGSIGDAIEIEDCERDAFEQEIMEEIAERANDYPEDERYDRQND